MGSLTSSLDTRAGTGTITVTHTDLPSGTFEVFSIDKLGVEFDVKDNSDNADSVFFAPSEFKVTAGDRLDVTESDKSFFSYLDSISTLDEIEMSLYFKTDDGHEWTDVFTFTPNDVSYSRLKRQVSFEAILQVLGDALVTDVFNDFPGDVYTIEAGDGAGSVDCMPVNRYFDNIFKSLSSNNSTNINTTQKFGDDPFTGSKVWVIKDSTPLGISSKAEEAFYKALAMDGAVAGSLLGINFTAHRLDTSDSVSLSEDDVEDLDIDLGLRNYSSIYTVFNADRPDAGTNDFYPWAEWGFLLGSDDELNSEAPKRLRVYFELRTLQPATWDSGSSIFLDDGLTFRDNLAANVDGDYEQGDKLISTTSSMELNGDLLYFDGDVTRPHLVEAKGSSGVVLETGLLKDISNGDDIGNFINKQSTIAQGAAEAYAHAYGANGARQIELTILDIDTLNPNQTFTLDSSFPDSVSGATYRPTEIEYDIFSDRIHIKAYAIS